MVVGFAGATFSGFFVTLTKKFPRFVNTHLPWACIGFFAFFAHGHRSLLGKPFGDYVVICAFVGSLLLYALFFIFHRLHRVSVIHQANYGDPTHPQYIFLALQYANSSAIPPGSFFNIYSNNGGALAIFHGTNRV